MLPEDVTPGGAGDRPQQQELARPNDLPSEALSSTGCDASDCASRTTSAKGKAPTTAKPVPDVAARGPDNSNNGAHIPDTSGRNGAASAAASADKKDAKCLDDGDVDAYNAATKVLVVAEDNLCMADSGSRYWRERLSNAEASLALPSKEREWRHSFGAAQAVKKKAATHAFLVGTAVHILATARGRHTKAPEQLREADVTLTGTLQGFGDKYGQDAVDAIAEGRELATSDALSVDNDSDGKRKRSTADLDVVASKAGKHGGGASAAAACSMARRQEDVDTSISAGHLQQRWLSTIQLQRADVEAKGKIATEAESKMASIQELEASCRFLLASEDSRAAEAESTAVAHCRLWKEARASLRNLSEAREYHHSNKALTAARKALDAAIDAKKAAEAVFHRAVDGLGSDEWSSLLGQNAGVKAVFADISRRYQEEDREWRRYNCKVPAPVILPKLTGWNRFSPAMFFRVALQQKAEQEEEKRKAQAAEDARAAGGAQARRMTVARGHSYLLSGAKRKEEGEGDDGAVDRAVDDGVACVELRRSTRESRPTPEKQLGQQQKRRRL